MRSLLLSLVLTGSCLAMEGDIALELSPETETSIARALEYLSQNQNRDGSWGGRHRVANTSLALMAFMVKGHFADAEPYGRQIGDGLDYLLRVNDEKKRGYDSG